MTAFPTDGPHRPFEAKAALTMVFCVGKPWPSSQLRELISAEMPSAPDLVAASRRLVCAKGGTPTKNPPVCQSFGCPAARGRDAMLQAAIWRRSGCAQALHAPVGPNKGNLRFQHSKLLAGLWKSCLHSSQSGEGWVVRTSGGLGVEQSSPLCNRREGRVEIESE